MSLFSQIVDSSAALSLITPSAPVPAPGTGPQPRFAFEPVRWVAAGNGASVFAFARAALRVFSGPSNGIPGDSASAWTLLEVSPLPAFAPQALLALTGGLPVQYVLLGPQAHITAASNQAADNQCVSAGEVIAVAGPLAAPSVWFGVCVQDRIVRDPTLWSSQIAAALSAAGVDAGSWTPFAAALANLGSPARAIYLLDHVGRPLRSGTFTISTGVGSRSVTLTAASDGNTGVPLPASGQASIAFTSAAHPLIAGAEVDGGNFEGAYQLAPGERHAQATDAETWFDERDAGVTGGLARWNRDSFVVPIVDGNPYFAQLVADLEETKNGGGVGLAGWAFVKESLIDKTLQWPLIPGKDDTALVPLMTDLAGHGSQICFLVNQFLQFESPTLDDSITALGILWALFAANFPVSAFGWFTTDPAGFGALLGGLAAADFLINSPLTLDVLRMIGEQSKSAVDDLSLINNVTVKWSKYPATTADNPLFTPPLSIVGINIDDIIHFGVYHQKFVVGKKANGDYFGYLGGIDINNDRPDSPLHRVLFPYHDVQARLTGPALGDLIQSFAERCVFEQAPLPFSLPVTPPQTDQGRHLVQIARTYYRPKTGIGLPFAPSGETLIHRTNIRAIEAAQDFIYIEEQYFTPDDRYVDALVSAASHAKALIITVCMENGQAFGYIRRNDVLNKLRGAWGTKMKVGAPLRRFLNPTPEKTVNLGRCVLMAKITANDTSITIGPASHVPPAPFWAFVENELLQVTAVQPPDLLGNLVCSVFRGPTGSQPNWGAKVDKHDAGSAVMCVRVPHIYVHAKLMIVDDVFFSLGSANMNRRGYFHDGEINAMTISQSLKRDPTNPAHILRCRLWADHMGLTPEMGLTLLSDPLSALPYFDRSWYAGNRWQPLDWSGAQPDDFLGFSSSDTLMMQLLLLTVGAEIKTNERPLWPVLVDPTSFSDPSSNPGPELP